MCLAADVYAQKFGFQISENISGLAEQQKALNTFDKHVYFPTNWRENGVEVHKGKFPAFIRYGAYAPVPPEYLQKAYAGIYPITQQPTVDEGVPYARNRVS
jgi:hypothetical protein